MGLKTVDFVGGRVLPGSMYYVETLARWNSCCVTSTPQLQKSYSTVESAVNMPHSYA